MPRKSKLTTHALTIHELLRKGLRIRAVWRELEKQGVTVSYEGLRKWVHANPAEGVDLHGPGHPPSTHGCRFNILENGTPSSTPAFLLAFLAINAKPEYTRETVTKAAFLELGLPFDDGDRWNWVIPVERLQGLGDLELCFVVYLVSDLPSPPLSGNSLHFERWYEKLSKGAARLKTAIQEGRDVCGAYLFPEAWDQQ